MCDTLDTRYGPNWKLIKQYIEEIPEGFLFGRLGESESDDDLVERIHDWAALRQVVDYSMPDASRMNSRYLRFLTTVDEASNASKQFAGAHGLAAMVENAVNDAAEAFADEGGDWTDEQLTRLLSSDAYEAPYPFCEFSFQDHCAYIAAELVVAHVSPIHLLRDMWHWYRRGHWPCGWEGEWPEGRLIVF